LPGINSSATDASYDGEDTKIPANPQGCGKALFEMPQKLSVKYSNNYRQNASKVIGKFGRAK